MSSLPPCILHLVLLLALLTPAAHAIHHMKRAPIHWVPRDTASRPLRVTNNCDQDIYPGILTQSGTGPSSSGFKLSKGQTNVQTVSENWQGRVWARTNCSFNTAGTAPASGIPGPACTTGDCGGTVACKGTGEVPATLAEFTLETGKGQSFYDISMVDGYNLPMGIIFLTGDHSSSSSNKRSTNSSLDHIPPNLTNPVCIGTASYLITASQQSSDSYLGSNSSYPIPLDKSVTQSSALRWCPWPLQLNPPTKPGDGVYPYPDDKIARPEFNPCISACSKNRTPQDCCTGKYGSPSSCKPSLYSQNAKKVCPDAYSYAFDDQDSTFIVPSGGGFEIVFCPAGRSSTILKTFGDQMRQLAATGQVSMQMQDLLQNKTYIALKSRAVASPGGGAHNDLTQILLAVVLPVGLMLLFGLI